MLFRTQFAIGAILFFQSIAFGSNFAQANEIDDKRNLRGGDLAGEDKLSQQEHRELRPYGYGNGFGYTTNNNRYSTPRVAGSGSQRLRPYRPAPVRAVSPFAGKAAKSEKYYKSYKAYKGQRPQPLQPTPQRGTYLNSMHWQRVPGQPMFVSNNELPTVFILDAPPTFIADADGNEILVDGDGNEIVVEENEDGNVVVSVAIGEGGGVVDNTSTNDSTGGR